MKPARAPDHPNAVEAARSRRVDREERALHRLKVLANGLLRRVNLLSSMEARNPSTRANPEGGCGRGECWVCGETWAIGSRVWRRTRMAVPHNLKGWREDNILGVRGLAAYLANVDWMFHRRGPDPTEEQARRLLLLDALPHGRTLA